MTGFLMNMAVEATAIQVVSQGASTCLGPSFAEGDGDRSTTP